MDNEDAMNININLSDIKKQLELIVKELKRFNDNRL